MFLIVSKLLYICGPPDISESQSSVSMEVVSCCHCGVPGHISGEAVLKVQ